MTRNYLTRIPLFSVWTRSSIHTYLHPSISAFKFRVFLRLNIFCIIIIFSRDAARERGEEEERQRSELSADEIETLRSGGGLPEADRSSSSSARLHLRPSPPPPPPPPASPSRHGGRRGGGKRKQKSSAFGGRRQQQQQATAAVTTRRPSIFSKQFSSRATSTAPPPRAFGRPKPSSGLRKGSKTTIGIQAAAAAGGNTRNNFSPFSRHTAAASHSPRRGKKKSRLRKPKQGSSRVNFNSESVNFKSKSFTNFGNGQSRFGNF